MNSFLFNVFFASCALIILPSAQAGIYSFSGVSQTSGSGISRLHAEDSELGIVGGLRPCGGPGQVVEWRYEPCKGESVCKIPGDGQHRRSEFEFIPSEDIESLGVRLNVVTEKGTRKVFEKAIPNSAVEGGQTYISVGSGGPSKELIGKSYTLQYIIYRTADDSVEVCGEADFEVVEP